MPRPPVKFGLLPGPSLPRGYLSLESYLTEPLPPAPPSDDFTAGIVDWGMGGNDAFGDCGPCADYHQAMADAANAHETVPPTPDDGTPAELAITKEYFAYDNNQDVGVNLAQWFTYRMSNGLAGLPPLGGFVQVPLTGDLFASAIHTFGGVIAGIYMSADSEYQWRYSIPWDNTDTTWIGAHAIPILARDASGGKAITWGTVQPFTWPWWNTVAFEAYIIFTQEQMQAPGGVFCGVNVRKLAQDLQELGGNVTAQVQVTADSAAMQGARIELNNANKVLETDLTPAEYAKLHPALAKCAGILEQAEKNAQSWLTANPA